MSGISTLDIDEKLESVPNFLGAFPFDELPEKPDDDFSVIVNTEPGGEPGAHWIPIIFKNKIFYFVDSFGRLPGSNLFSQNFKKTIKMFMNGYKCKSNVNMIQHIFANTCGYYAIYFIREMQEKTMADALSIFTSNLVKNDSLVVKIVNGY